MRIDKFGLVELNSDDSFNILYRGNLNIHDYFFDKDTTDLFNKGIEINKDVFEALKYNCIQVYHRRNMDFHLGDCSVVIPKLLKSKSKNIG